MDLTVDIVTKNCPAHHHPSSRTYKRFSTGSMLQVRMEPRRTMANILLLEMWRVVKREAGPLLRRYNRLVPLDLLHSKWHLSYLQRKG